MAALHLLTQRHSRRSTFAGLAALVLIALSINSSVAQTAPAEVAVVASVEENSPAGTSVVALSERYPGLSNFRFSQRGRSTLFAIDRATGLITVRDSAVLDFERRPTVQLTVIADVNAVQNDPYLDEFAESLRGEGLSNRKLARLIPSEQRIQVRIELTDVEEATEMNGADDATVIVPAEATAAEQAIVQGDGPFGGLNVAPMESVVVENTPVESASVADAPLASSPVASMPLTAATPAEQDVPRLPDIPVRSSPAETPLVAEQVPMPADAEAVVESPTRTVAVPGAMNDAALSLPEQKSDVMPADNPVASEATRDDAAERAMFRRTLLIIVFCVVVLLTVLAVVLVRHHRLRAPVALSKEDEESAVEIAAESLPEVVEENAAAELCEQEAADEFVAEQREEAETAPAQMKFVDEVDDGAPFDPESLFDDAYFNETDVEELKSQTAVLVEELESRAGAEQVPANVETIVAEELDDRVTYNSDDVTSTEPRWNSDWPGYSEKRVSETEASPANAVAEGSEPSNVSVATLDEEDLADDPMAGLRSELAGLFAMEKRAAVSPVPQRDDALAEPVPEVRAELDAELDAEVKVASAPSSEETHLESVAQYLSQLLERSKKEETADSIFADRRKSEKPSTKKWDGIDRRGGSKSQPQKPQVKSYIESYYAEQSGSPTADRSVPIAAETNAAAETPPALVERRPVDVQKIRQHMTSFRSVATVAVEHALASHRIRQAEGKRAWRTSLMVGLSLVMVLAVTTSAATKMYYPSLSWLTGIIVCLAVAELVLRVQGVRRHRRELRYRIVEAARKTETRNTAPVGSSDAVTEPSTTL